MEHILAHPSSEIDEDASHAAVAIERAFSGSMSGTKHG
jgi:hypothetical protein